MISGIDHSLAECGRQLKLLVIGISVAICGMGTWKV
jgi:hypothetical protein